MRRAIADIERIFTYLDERSPAGAISVKRALKRSIATIEAFPMGGRLSGKRKGKGAKTLQTGKSVSCCSTAV